MGTGAGGGTGGANTTVNKANLPSWQRNGLPTLHSTNEEIRAFFDRQINPLSARRRWHTQRAAENLWFYLGRQWILPRPELLGTNGAFHFEEIYRHSRATFPRPVTNLCSVAVDNEVARLTRKEYVPDATASKNKPEWMAAAKLARDLVRWELSKQAWSETREETAFNLVIDAVSILRTWWDETDVDLTLVAPPDAAMCPTCERKYSSVRVPRGFATIGMPNVEGAEPMRHAETLRDVEETGEASALHPSGIPQVQMTHCPYCEEPTELQPYDVSPEDANGGQDAFGRELGLFVPRGEGLLDVVSLHELFPENGGIGVEPHKQRVVGMMAARPLEWIAVRFPELAAKLEPERAEVMLKLNPIYADRSFRAFSERGDYGGHSAGYETYYNHARLQELVIQPQPGIAGLENGAWFARTYNGDEIVRRELCVEVEGPHEELEDEEGHVDEPVKVPRVKFHFARFKRIPRMFWGWTFLNDLKPINRRLNEIDAQIIDLRERGIPNMWIPAGVEVNTRDDVGGSLNIVEFDGAMSGWTPREGIFPGSAITGNDYLAERRAILEDARLVGMPQDIEIGASPGSVKTTSGLMLLSEEASQKRGPRERALTGLYESAFDHILQLNMAFRKEPANYEVADESSRYEIKSFTGDDLMPNVRVKMNARAGYDQTLYNKEAAAEAMDRGLYVIDSPAARDRVLDLLKLPKDVNEGSSLQVQSAEEAWTDFKRTRKMRRIDPTIDDAVAWYSVLAKHWFDDEAKQMQREAGWEDVLPKIVGWEARKAAIEQAEAPAKMIYGSVPPEQWQAIYEQGSQLAQAAAMAFQRAQAAWAALPPEQQAAAPPPPPPQPFPPPPQQPFLPDQPEDAVYAVWMRMAPDLQVGIKAAETVRAAAGPAVDVAEIDVLEGLLRFRSVIEAYRLLMAPPMPMMPPGPAGAAPPPGGPAGGPAAPPKPAGPEPKPESSEPPPSGPKKEGP